MDYVIRCEPAKEGANPQPKPNVLRVYSTVKRDWVLRDSSPTAVLAFLAGKAQAKELSWRNKEIAQVQKALATDPAVGLG